MDISMMLPYLDRFPHAKLLVNYRGYGLSTGTPTEQDIMGDSLAILDSVLKETGRTPDDVILVGQSLGSGVATQIASVRHVKNWCCWFLLTAFWKQPAASSRICPSNFSFRTTSGRTWPRPKSPALSAFWLRERMKLFPHTTPNGFGTVSPYRSATRNFPAPCIIPSGSAPALTKRFPKASGTDPVHSAGARDTRRRQLPSCSSNSHEASSGNASGNRLAHSTMSTVSPSRYSSHPMPSSSDSFFSR